MEKLESGTYWVRAAYTDAKGESTSYLNQHLITEDYNYLENKHYVLKWIMDYGGTNPGEVTFRRVT